MSAADVIAGDVFSTLPTIAPGSIDCVVTSPPYWMLRSYLPKGHPLKPLELGSEAKPAEYVANMVKVLDLVRNAMADHATLWLNVGDTYTHAPNKRKPTDAYGAKQMTNGYQSTVSSASAEGIDAGNLCLIPWRLAIALQDAGWIVRSVVVWHKPAPMPSSVSGWAWRRCRVKVRDKARHEWNGKAANVGEKSMGGSGRGSGLEVHREPEWSDCPGCRKCNPHGGYVLRRGSWRPTSSWEPVLMLAKSPNYFCDGEAVKTQAAAATVSRDQYTRIIDDPDEQFAVRHDHETVTTTANLRDVWTIAAEPLKEKHYAAYPSRLVSNCLRAGTSSRGYCPACGGPWVRVVESETNIYGRKGAIEDGKATGGRDNDGKGASSWAALYGAGATDTKTIGWRPSCQCPEQEPRPGRVLDPFAGSGRTGIEAGRLGLDFVGCELNPDYVAMARRKLREDAPLFNMA